MSATGALQQVLPLVGVIIGALLTFLTQSFFHWRTRRRERKKTLAILAQTLDLFAEECGDAVERAELYHSSGGHAGNSTSNIPDLSEPKDSIELSGLPSKLLSEYLAMQIKVILARRRIGFWWQIGERDAAPEEAYEQAGLLGFDAIQLARRMRKAAGLPEPDYATYYYDIEKALADPRNRALESLARSKPNES